jgi:glutamine amidotransferase
MGNLFSVKNMCAHVGMDAKITSSKQDIISADAVILPGVGAFGDAMGALNDLGLTDVLKDIASSDKPLIGICLGMQLLMSESYEFGKHKGLDIIKGSVIKLNEIADNSKKIKVPHVCWDRIWQIQKNLSKPHKDNNLWSKTLLDGLSNGEFMYFVHSFYVKPVDSEIILSVTKYGNVKFCSSFQYKNIFGCQFHPERSSYQGMRLYSNLIPFIENFSKGK